jgi:hypothetical protein
MRIGKLRKNEDTGITSLCYLLEKLSFIRRRPINRRYQRLIEAQVHGELPAVVGKVAENAVADHDMPRIFVHHMATHD